MHKTALKCRPSLTKLHRAQLRRDDERPVRFRRFPEAHVGQVFPIFRGKSRRESRARCTLAYWNTDLCVQSNVAPRALSLFFFLILWYIIFKLKRLSKVFPGYLCLISYLLWFFRFFFSSNKSILISENSICYEAMYSSFHFVSSIHVFWLSI